MTGADSRMVLSSRAWVAAVVLVAFSNAAGAEEKVLTDDGVVLAHPEVPRITAEELRQLIDEKADVVIVDTRDALSYEYGHIPGAINIYYDPTADPTTRELILVALPGDKLIALYCP
ncbi:MAG TPA: rhodanese-like domain-containing protein [Gammaproteobacteria bacterium]